MGEDWATIRIGEEKDSPKRQKHLEHTHKHGQFSDTSKAAEDK
jgi:hypothetical protein